MDNTLETIADYIRYAYSRMNEAEVYFGHGTDNSWDEAVHLVLQTLHLPWDFDREMWVTRVVTSEKVKLDANIRKRVEQRMPLPYITNEAWFCGMPFYVDERVLVPRSPISELIQNHFMPWWYSDRSPGSILDLCTGSGCIGIACAEAYPEASVDLIDISADALEVAQRNIERFGLDHRVRAIASNLFEGLEAGETYDLIVSNPPYVDASDFASMPVEYQKEPELGLVAGADGLDLVRVILAEAPKYLAEDGLLVVEVGNSWEALEAAYPEIPFTWIEFEEGGHGVFVMTASELSAL